MSSLGLIETKGLVAAIEAADAMVKSADVRIIERHQIGGGLVTITVTGEVSAVNAAVDAAIVAVARIEGAELISSHVIPRPYDEVSTLFAAEKRDSKTDVVITTEELPSSESISVPEQKECLPTTKEDAPDVKMSDPQQVQTRFTRSELQKLQVTKLRKLAEGIEGISLSRQAIKTATKKKLIEAILNVTK